MVLKDILSIAGKPGLFKYVSQGRGGAIVESVLDGKRMLASASQRVSSLEDIAIFTDTEDVPLAKVFDAVYEKENGARSIDAKSADMALRDHFETVLPSYDRERVYISDIKKVYAWYNLLHEHNLLVKEAPEDTEKTEEPAKAEEPVAPKPEAKAKSTAAKGAAAPKATKKAKP